MLRKIIDTVFFVVLAGLGIVLIIPYLAAHWLVNVVSGETEKEANLKQRLDRLNDHLNKIKQFNGGN